MHQTDVYRRARSTTEGLKSLAAARHDLYGDLW